MLPEQPCAIWLTGLPAAGKSTLAHALVAALAALQRPALLLDGDVLRNGPHRDLGFSREDRAEQCRRIAILAIKGLAAGQWPVIAVISPYRRDRAEALRCIGQAVEIYVATPLAICIARDPKGLYAAAECGERRHVTGIDDPYEEPEQPDLVVDSSTTPTATSVAQVLNLLSR